MIQDKEKQYRALCRKIARSECASFKKELDSDWTFIDSDYTANKEIQDMAIRIRALIERSVFVSSRDKSSWDKAEEIKSYFIRETKKWAAAYWEKVKIRNEY